MTMYFKATRPDGTDFRTGTVDYGAALVSGDVVRHLDTTPTHDRPSTYLSVSVAPESTLLGGYWPCRLFLIEPEGVVLDGLSACRNKRAVSALRVVEEFPAHMALGPNGFMASAWLDTVAEKVRSVNLERWYAAYDAAYLAAYDAACDAARYAARHAAYDAAYLAAYDAAYDAARYAARYAAYAAGALVTRDLISAEHFASLTRLWCEETGEAF